MKPSAYPAYLPNPLLKADGSQVSSPAEWAQQQQYIRDLAQAHLYGPWPGKTQSMRLLHRFQKTTHAGKALREHMTLLVNNDFPFSFEIVRPAGNTQAPIITLNYSPALEPSRCPVEEEIVSQGYAIAAFDRGQIRPDPPVNGEEELALALNGAGVHLSCGTIMAWAWGHSILADYLEQCAYAGPLIAAGHSRGGKSALCAGLFDPRFQVVAPMASGCGGLGTLRFSGTADGRRQDPDCCQTIGHIVRQKPSWFCPQFSAYGAQEAPYSIDEAVNDCPLDAHMLRAGCAPNAVFNVEGEEDHWANPFGAQLGWQAAQPVFDLLGVPQRNGFHMRCREEAHEISIERLGHRFDEKDWLALAAFCNLVLGRQKNDPAPWESTPYFSINLADYAPWILSQGDPPDDAPNAEHVENK